MTRKDRRWFLVQALSSALAGIMASAGLLAPVRLLASSWPRQAFAAQDLEGAQRQLHGTAGTRDAAPGSITIKAPREAENGAVVPITIATDLPDVEQIAVFGEKNRIPLIANARFSGARPYLSLRIKMGESSDLHVVVKTANGLYRKRQHVLVAAGGCAT